MTTTVSCSESARVLIDARLDTIDRMLLGRMSRRDRLAIVREVEIQIQELLDQRGRDEVGREDVLEVLSRLDPPEAFLPEEDDGDHPSPRPAGAPRATPAPRRRNEKAARAAGWLGVGALVLALLGPWSALALHTLFPDGGGVFLLPWCLILASVVMAPVAVVLGVFGRRGGIRAGVGIMAGVVTILTLVIEFQAAQLAFGSKQQPPARPLDSYPTPPGSRRGSGPVGTGPETPPPPRLQIPPGGVRRP